MPTIDITTTQNVTIEYELAGPQDRFLAFFIDAVIVGALFILIFLVLFDTWAKDIEEGGMLGHFLSFLPLTLFVIYHLLSEILANGQSWGKKAAGIKVVRLDGEEPGWSDYLLRAVFHVVDTFLSFCALAGILINSSAKKQRLGDMTANTVVIKTRFNKRFQLTDILKINSIEEYEPTYLEVRKLREQDLLLIKSAIQRYHSHKNPAHTEVIDKLVNHLVMVLDLDEVPTKKIEFLQTLIRDYIVLTR